MHRILLAVDSYELLCAIRDMQIWGCDSGFQIEEICRDGRSAYRILQEQKYDMAIIEIRIAGIDGLQLLRKIKKEGLCEHIVLCSEFSDFDYARQGIIFGAFDFLVPPFKEKMFQEIFARIQQEESYEDDDCGYVKKLLSYFRNRDETVQSYFTEVLDEIYRRKSDILQADKQLREIYRRLEEQLFDSYEWLDLYIGQPRLDTLDGICEGNYNSYLQYYSDRLMALFHEFCELYPKVNNTQIQTVILYILNNPESDLKQKNIAETLHMNSSFLSTIFATNTELRFVDYLTLVKLKRAGWLLQNTEMKILDIANRLDYKDTGYFSRLFKTQYGVTPTEYRIKENYNYQI